MKDNIFRLYSHSSLTIRPRAHGREGDEVVRPQSRVARQEGFTLVELLVVIAIIAVLSAIAIVNLNSARNKGNDVAIRANLAALFAAAEIYYDDEGYYTGFCTASSINGIRSSVQSINNFDCANDINPKACFDCDTDPDAWIVFGRLYDGRWFCVDYSGTQSVTSTPNSGTCL